jgi:hypothetical protein
MSTSTKKKPKRKQKAVDRSTGLSPEHRAELDPLTFIELGGLAYFERQAVRQAVRECREHWLKIIEGWLARISPDDDLNQAAHLAGQIASLKRLLGIEPSPEEVLAAARERSRRYRERRRKA